MLDSGATRLFVSKCYVECAKLLLQHLRQDFPLHNIDGSNNKAGAITHFARLRLQVGLHDKEWDFLVTDLGPEDIILGLLWLREVNSQIDWKEEMLDIEAVQRPQKVDTNRKFRCA